MTEKLYDRDPYLAEAPVKVLSCTRSKESWVLELDQTIFFARGGGQPCEAGTIGDAQVLDVYEENGHILHIVDRPVSEGDTTCRIDFAMRFDHMQQHLGEHIFSAVLEQLYGCRINILRIEADSSHIEIPVELTPEQLLAAQTETCRIIAQDLPVTCYFLTPEEAAAVAVRGRVSPHERIRMVKIGDNFDCNGCGGTHCRSTGEVEDFLLCGTKLVRGCFRIYFKCGTRAHDEADARTLPLLHLQTAYGVETLQQLKESAMACLERKNALEEQVLQLKQALLASDCTAYLAQSTAIGNHRFLALQLDDVDVKHLRAVCDAVTAEHDATFLFSVRHNSQSSLLFARTRSKTGPNLGTHLKNLVTTFEGRGGGSVILAQGMMPDTNASRQAFQQTADAVAAELKDC